MHLLAHDSDGSVSSAHLVLGDHVEHLNESACVGHLVRGPLRKVELSYNKTIVLRRALLWVCECECECVCVSVCV